MTGRWIVSAFLFWILQAYPGSHACADSPFAIGSFGVPVVPTDGRGMGMGGVSVALTGEVFSPLNPASLAAFQRSAISGMVNPGYSFPRDRSGSGAVRSYEFSYVDLVFPVPAKFVISAGLFQVLDFDWETYRVRDSIYQGESLTETYRSTGALFRAQLAAARPLFSGIRAGIGVDFYRGEISDLMQTIYQGTLYPIGGAIDVSDRYAYEASGLGVSLGFLYEYSKRFSAGFYLSPSFDLTLDEEFRTNPGTISRRTLTAGMPDSWGFGFSARPWRYLLLAFDHRWTDWSSFSIVGGDRDDLQDERSISLGFEIASSRRDEGSWVGRSAIRGGFRSRSLPMVIEGNGVDERVVTAGWGIPLGGGRGRLDIGAELGSRGGIEENGIQERIVRFGVSLSAFEKWIPIERTRGR